MSSANLYVRFPDGTVRYGIYHGTSDIAQPSLYGTPDEAWDGRPFTGNDWEGWEEGEGEPVDVATDYGGGWSWKATATPDRLTSGHDWDGMGERIDGEPYWATYPGAVEQ